MTQLQVIFRMAATIVAEAEDPKACCDAIQYACETVGERYDGSLKQKAIAVFTEYFKPENPLGRQFWFNDAPWNCETYFVDYMKPYLLERELAMLLMAEICDDAWEIAEENKLAATSAFPVILGA